MLNFKITHIVIFQFNDKGLLNTAVIFYSKVENSEFKMSLMEIEWYLRFLAILTSAIISSVNMKSLFMSARFKNNQL